MTIEFIIESTVQDDKTNVAYLKIGNEHCRHIINLDELRKSFNDFDEEELARALGRRAPFRHSFCADILVFEANQGQPDRGSIASTFNGRRTETSLDLGLDSLAFYDLCRKISRRLGNMVAELDTDTDMDTDNDYDCYPDYDDDFDNDIDSEDEWEETNFFRPPGWSRCFD